MIAKLLFSWSSIKYTFFTTSCEENYKKVNLSTFIKQSFKQKNKCLQKEMLYNLRNFV